ncbi:hypothetical protein A2110_02310 [Candidatus Jorgensenbacteria bacterium GWA1_54_12]|uniref:Uncharacterized protein n=1 Tax=Candidatus Jorgensenbacteria bacterium GWA1_54_12 TaxID=1798468 RepID=A0A1F6BKV3_9BACT|nr:MAG: hypothetical protein A2110_02310 [Candidatus Jorgensenbacteria bacterium GWA1_54_12]
MKSHEEKQEIQVNALSSLNPKMKAVFAAVAVIALGASGAAYYFYSRYATLMEEPQRIAQEDTSKLLERVGRLIVLPVGEEPTIATVSDPEKLKDQAFFANAQIGFKVLIYANAKKAILYDPSGDKIVEVAPVNIGNP